MGRPDKLRKKMHLQSPDPKGLFGDDYLLRNSGATAAELEYCDEDAQALLGHRHVNMTKKYSKTQLQRRERMARDRKNPFEEETEKS